MSQYHRNNPEEPIRHDWFEGCTRIKARYYAKRFARGAWHVIGPSGHPLYDNAPHGQDKPIVFHDEDAAVECASRCNLDDKKE